MSTRCSISRNQHPIDSLEEKWKRESSNLLQDFMSLSSSEMIKNHEEIGTVEDIYRLSYIQSLMFATIIEDAITEVRILAASNNELRVCKTLNTINLLRSLKYDIEQPLEKDELDGINPSEISSDTYKLKKLDNDREQLSDAITATYIELSKTSTWKVLAEKIKSQNGVYDHRINTAEEETSNRASRRDLARQLRQLRNHIKSANYDTDLKIESLITKVEDSAVFAQVQTRYTENWERARFEQHLQTITNVEAPPGDAINDYKRHIDQEQRVHVEIETLINICINETLHKVESWMSKYEKDIEVIDLKIQLKKNEYELTLEKREELEETLEKHEKEIEIWIDFKEEREKARLYREKMNRSAVTVQAWWRGLLVRFQMGPYKVVKKPKKSGPKKK